MSSFKNHNQVTILGNLGGDPEVIKNDQGEITVAKFSIATTGRTHKDRDGNEVTNTEWHQAVCFGKRAEIASKYLQKGSKVMIEGELRYRTYQSQCGCTHTKAQVIPNKIVFLDKIASPNHEENGHYNNNGREDGYGY